MSKILNEIHVYFDGGATNNPGPGGWGFVLINYIKNVIAKGAGGTIHATNNEMELVALKEALLHFTRYDIPIVIHTDSQYVQGICTGVYKAKKHIELVNQIKLLLNKFINYRFVKVKAHSGDKYNELADQLTYIYRGQDEGKVVHEPLSAPPKVATDSTSNLPMFQ